MTIKTPRLESLAHFQNRLAGFAVLLILVHVSLDVLMRYMLNSPIPATLEVVSFYYMIALTFLPMLILEYQDKHIKTDLFFRQFPKALQRVSIAASGLMAVFFYWLLTYVCFEEALSATHRGEVVMGVHLLPIWPARWLLPVAFLSASIGALFSTIRALSSGGGSPYAEEGEI
ncbi:TRAP transporter small permease [Desulfobacula sp.]|uniref:TRAP transporter small permease n=1 Tax=Desulfobacula sp. TaxID=2593537 RepID=UPI002714FFDE|nr:TRAP transporter small permease [Desulfobacula sp.]